MSTTFLNGGGHFTLIWDDNDSERMETFIQKKLDQGYAFYILEPRAGGLASPTKRKITSAKDVTKNLSVAFEDPDILDVADIVQPIKQERRQSTGKRAKTAREVVKKDTIAVKPRAGG